MMGVSTTNNVVSKTMILLMKMIRMILKMTRQKLRTISINRKLQRKTPTKVAGRTRSTLDSLKHCSFSERIGTKSIDMWEQGQVLRLDLMHRSTSTSCKRRAQKRETSKMLRERIPLTAVVKRHNL